MIRAGRNLSATCQALAPWTGAFVVLELAVLFVVSDRRYVPLTRATNADALQVLHLFSQVLAVGFLLFLALAAGRRALSGPGAVGEGTRRGLWALHLAAFAGLIALYQILPPWPEVAQVLTASEIAVLGAMVGAFLVFLATAFGLVAPATFRPYWRSPLTLGIVATGLAAATLVVSTDWLTLAAIRRPIEGATLSMSVAFYGLTGLPAPQLDFSGVNPVMSAAGFAIIIAPVCSGYQGLFSAAAILGGYVGLERSALRLWRAVAVAVVALGLVFVMNAARIALLFAIGVNGYGEVAVNGFHSNFGVLSLLAVVALAILVLETAPLRRAGGVRLPALSLPPRELETIGRLMLPLAALMAASIVVGLAAGTVNWLYPVSTVMGALVLWHVRADLLARLEPGPSVVGFGCGIVVFGLWVVLVPPDRMASGDFAVALMAAPLPVMAAWIVVRVIGASVVVPLVEELAFRGGLMRLIALMLPGAVGPWGRGALAVLGSSVAFGLLHAEVVAGIVAGLFYGALAVWRGSLADPIVAHAVTNFLLALTVLGLGHWSYW